jgi:formylglycine-generating enzyme required for sulfatase activity
LTEGLHAPAYHFTGRIDEARVSQTARYERSFTPPETFGSDADTLALYRFDEGAGDVLRDSSGNNHHGKIVGAKWVRIEGVVPTVVAPPPDPDAYAAQSGLPVKFNNSLGMKFRLIPPGEFMMGSAEQNPALPADDRTPHKVRITKPFYLGTYEVSQQEYEDVTGATPSFFKDDNQLPVEMVSWLDAVAFCNALSAKEGLSPCYGDKWARIPGGTGYRLPTEAEWEYAARAGTTGTYYFGDPADLDQHAWIDTNSKDKMHLQGRTRSVGIRAVNPWGLHDVYGNVWEWCGDWYGADYYKTSPVDDPQGPATGTYAVFRGGAWDASARGMNNSYARPFSNAVYVGPRERRDSRIGFRVVLSTEGAKQIPKPPKPNPAPPVPASSPVLSRIAEVSSNLPDTSVWPSADGLRLYVARDREILQFARTAIGQPFAGGKVVAAGRMLTLTEDELDIAALDTAGGAQDRLVIATRTARDQPFGPASAVAGVDPALKSPCFSSTGLALFFQSKDAGGASALRYITRGGRRSAWSQPQDLKIVRDPALIGALTWPWLSRDGLTLLCTEESGNAANSGRLWRFTRAKATDPFDNPRGVSDASGGSLYGRSSRLCEATGELFFSGTERLADQSQWMKNDWDIWVLSNFGK